VRSGRARLRRYGTSLPARVSLLQASYYAFAAPLPLALTASGIEPALVGLIVGLAPFAQIGASLAVPGLVSRVGAHRTLVLGGGAYVLGALGMALASVSIGPTTLVLTVSRLAQGLGFGLVLPAGYVRASEGTRNEMMLAYVATANGLALAVLPPLSLLVYSSSSFTAVALSAAVLAVLGVALDLRIARSVAPTPAVPKVWWPGFDGRWLVPLCVAVLFLPYWGVVLAYLQQEAQAANLNGGLFFTADALSLLLLRVPAGVLVRRMSPASLMVLGAVITLVCVGVLALPLDVVRLLIAGVASGAGSAFVTTALLIDLSRRSHATTDGASFAYYSVSQAVGVAAGSGLGAALVSGFGFVAAILVSGACIAAAGALALLARPQRAISGASR
jgi:MFS family permease